MLKLLDWSNRPLRQKLTLVILFTCSASLLLACTCLSIYQISEYLKLLESDATALADVLSKNTQAALAFDDENAAQQTLSGLQAEPSVAAAAIYDASGRRFANFTRTGSSAHLPDQPSADGSTFGPLGLEVARPIWLNDRRIGTLYMQVSLQGLYGRLWLFLGIAFLVLVLSLLAAYVLSARLQRPISQPIHALAEIARRIAANKDYSLRAPPQGQSEIGQLTESFNQFVASIEERDKSLREEVAERKAAEDQAQSQLQRLQLLQRITRAIGERQDLHSIFQVVIRTLEDNLPVDFACICLYDPTAHVLTVTGVGMKSEEVANEIALTKYARVDIDQDGLARCISGHLVYEPDISGSPHPFPMRIAKGGLRALVAAPLLVESKVFGVLVTARRAPGSFSSGECEFLRQLSEHVALAAHQSQLNEALQQAYDDLRQTQQAVMQQERLRALGQMASGIAHDINNAISPVALYTESLLEKEPNLSARARDYLSTIQRAIEDVAHTVSRMKEFYRQRENQLTLTPVLVNQLVKQVIDLSRARWNDMPQQRGVSIELKTELEENVPAVLGIESEIREALINLVFNAVDAMPDGGTLTVRTKTAEAPPAPGVVSRPLVQIEISDSGVGMSEDTRRRCFEPFFTTKGERGTGLGLAMVYGIVRRHNADIEIDTAMGKGTTVRLSFPAPANPLSAPSAVDTAPPVPARLRLLIVDDDPLLIKSLRDTLESDGHAVTAASGGREGIEEFRKAIERHEPFAAVITDLGMPYVSGRQVAAAVKNLSPLTPVLLLTGWGQRMTAEGDIPEHVNRVLSKPPKLRELREALAQSVPTT
jgi:signal transduction histidine kinase/ActR/RegA family two-component response regulator/HAMP domain-containing protein